jgi:putative membrane protein
MRITFLIAASLMATACNDRAAETDMAGEAGVGNDAAGAFAADTPTAQQFAETAALSDMYEIESSRLALDKGESAQTREFAQMMITDHTRSSENLKAAIEASGQSLALPGEIDAAHEAQIDVLRSLSGADFDREYLSQQMAAHRQALDLLKAYGGNGDTAELRQFAQATIPVIQKHHDWLAQNMPAAGAMPGSTATTSSE